MTLTEAAQKLLARTEAQYTHAGMGQYHCNCCGAVAYDDSHDDLVSFHKEPHSPSCPWRLLAEALASAEAKP